MLLLLTRGGENYNRVVLSLALCSRLENFSRDYRAQMKLGPGMAKQQNLRESEDAGQVSPTKAPYPAVCESRMTQHHSIVFAARIARFAMNNIYGTIKRSLQRLPVGSPAAQF